MAFFASSLSPSYSLPNLPSKPNKFFTKIHPFSFLQRPPISRPRCSLPFQGRESLNFNLLASVTTADVLLDEAVEEVQLPKGDTWSIHKFGGTCVGTSERIRNVANIVVKDESERKLVVVSAMSKKKVTTATELNDLANFLARLHQDINNLKAMLRAIYIAGHATESFSDFVVGHGELWSAQLLSAVVRKSGLGCTCMDTREVLVVNPTSSNQVDPDYVESSRRLKKWYSENSSDIIVATGFIATTPQNIPTTLKRDGSDFSAAIMGALFKARQVTIWTDVDGVYSADPRKVSEAVILKKLSYQEAWEMSYFGANVLHPRTIIPVMKYDIPIVIRNIFNLSAPGTMICRPDGFENEEGDRVESPVKGFATIDNLALVNVEGTGMAGVPGTASAIFGAVRDVGANVIMISQASSEHSVCFAVPEKEVKAVSAALESRFRQALDAGRLLSILATVGQKMASTPGVSATLFNALAKLSSVKICIKALRAVHSRFYLSRTTIAMGIIGPGLIGGTLLDQLRDQAAVLKEKFNIDLRVMGITGSKTMLLSDTGIDLSIWRDLQKEQGEKADMQKFVQHVHGNHFIPNTAIVDCTADSHVASRYHDWLRRGIHVITPNKKANSGPLEQYLKLRTLQRQSYTLLLKELLELVYQSLALCKVSLKLGIKYCELKAFLGSYFCHNIVADNSGTLSYIFNNFVGARTFSDVVKEAKVAGYTEPDPRDDLSGTDVARKVIILARESGLKLELADIPVQSLVPEPLKDSASAEEFMEKLPQYDQDLAKERQEAEAAGEVLRYVGVVDVVNKKGTVELRRYKKEHPFAQLSGSDNIIAFSTQRYEKQPLIVRGPGAGAEVTAGGVFSDILRLASYLGAPS
ncbi:UNVERIFIED_CONTAM: Bifunctional aspartokinase/homoserine dehydrogenase, chloroplastic [Sesamum calycinum]|uniref:Bifunctional aspartokinase/homoserine dehydrogenase, chloroplastic n=1 Tax=Sesamum calycinum TaxID=2727403 RepID=A0AAW2P722_9LAMI